jgi:OmpA-OmpF porin, OOP family
LLYRDTTMSPRGDLVHKTKIRISLQILILFDEWSSQIKPQFFPELNTIGESLRKELEKKDNAQVTLVIEGHTDKRGPLGRNMQLSKDRAEAIKNYLVQNFGIDPWQLSTDGYGPNRPYEYGDNEAAWALNRRVELKKLR